MITQTRFKFGIATSILVFLLAVAAHFLSAIPFIAACSALTGVYTVYVTGKSSTDNVESKNVSKP